MFSKLLFAVASAALCAGAAAAETTLRYAHFMPAASWQQQQMFLDWAEAVAKDSGGALDVTVFPAQTLGKAPAGYENARTGVADIAWTVQGYTAGRFPLSQIVELPGLFETAEIGSCAFQKLYDSGALEQEYADTHVLFVHVHAPGHIHSRDKAVHSPQDFAGMKIRRPTAVVGQLLSELGAEPVGMPAPGIYEAVQRGVIDGYMLPWEAVESFRVGEITKHHTAFGLYSLAFVSTMNKAKYEALPPEAKAAIDKNSGMDWALVAGRGYDAGDAKALETIKARGSEVYQIPEAERAEWEAAAARATEIYLSELEAAGLPGRATYEAVKDFVAQCEAELP